VCAPPTCCCVARSDSRGQKEALASASRQAKRENVRNPRVWSADLGSIERGCTISCVTRRTLVHCGNPRAIFALRGVARTEARFQLTPVLRTDASYTTCCVSLRGRDPGWVVAQVSQNKTLTNAPTVSNPTASNPMNLTPVSALTDNNTSAAGNFSSQSNGNLGANNVSKVNVHLLLCAGARTKVLAHLVLWFGQSGDMNVGTARTIRRRCRARFRTRSAAESMVWSWTGMVGTTLSIRQHSR